MSVYLAALLSAFIFSVAQETTITDETQNIFSTATKSCPLSQNIVESSKCKLPERKPAATSRYHRAFHQVWWEFQNGYAYFNERGVDWPCQYEKFKQMLGKNPDRSHFKNVAHKMLATLRDGHVRVDGNDTAVFGEAEPARHMPQINKQIANLQCKVQNNICTGSVKSNPDVGYLRINTMEEPVTPQLITNALKLLKDKKKMIVDLRFNDGGYDTTALTIAGHFTNKRVFSHHKEIRRGNKFINREKVFIEPKGLNLTMPTIFMSSPLTASAAEIGGMLAATNLAKLPNSHVKTLGENGEGITSDMDEFKVEGVKFSISKERYSSPACEIFEGKGVPPQIKSGYTQEGMQLPDRITAFDRYLTKGLQQGFDPDLDLALKSF